MVKCYYDAASEILTCRFAGHMDAHASADDDQVIRRLLAGRADDEPAGASAAPGSACAERPAYVIFDLKDVEFVSSAFFRVCIAFAKQMEKGRFAVQNTHPMVKKTFKVAGLDGLFEVS